MATVPRRGELRRLFALLSLWHGGPVDVVLTVARDSANWLDVWSEALGGVPARDERVRFEIARGACAGQSSGNSSGGGGGGRR
jgi:hypothetical protein